MLLVIETVTRPPVRSGWVPTASTEGYKRRTPATTALGTVDSVFDSVLQQPPY